MGMEQTGEDGQRPSRVQEIIRYLIVIAVLLLLFAEMFMLLFAGTTRP